MSHENHSIVWSFEDEHVIGEAICQASSDASCHYQAQCMCEEWDEEHDERGYYHMIEDQRHDHFFVAEGHCNLLDWLNADSPEVCADPLVRSYEIARTPIDVSWLDGYYVWKPA